MRLNAGVRNQGVGRRPETISIALVSNLGFMGVTLGPNNLLRAASGVHFGLQRFLTAEGPFQAVNPKAWVMVVNVSVLFVPRDLDPWLGALVLALAGTALWLLADEFLPLLNRKIPVRI